MRKPLAKCIATTPVRGLGAPIRPSHFKVSVWPQRLQLWRISALQSLQIHRAARALEPSLLNMEGTIFPSPPAGTSPFKGRLGGDVRATILWCSPPMPGVLHLPFLNRSCPAAPLRALPRPKENRSRGAILEAKDQGKETRARTTVAPAPPPTLPHQGGGAGPVVVEKGCLPYAMAPPLDGRGWRR